MILPLSQNQNTLRGSHTLETDRLSSKGYILLLLVISLLLQNTSAKAVALVSTKDSLKTKHVWLFSQVIPGSGQIINKQYWKVPVFYTGMGGMIYLAADANKSYKSYKKEYLKLDDSDPNKEYYQEKYTKMKVNRNLCYAGAGAFYLASVVDAVMVYNKGQHSPAAATIFSTLVPGLGQVYNKKYWKVPVVYGGLSTLWMIVDWNNRGYKRFKKAIEQFPKDEFNGERSVSELTIYENSFHRNRDVAFVGLLGVYVLNIIDASVDANLYDWNIDDNLSFRIEPTIINNNFAVKSGEIPAFGLTCSFNF